MPQTVGELKQILAEIGDDVPLVTTVGIVQTVNEDGNRQVSLFQAGDPTGMPEEAPSTEEPSTEAPPADPTPAVDDSPGEPGPEDIDLQF